MRSEIGLGHWLPRIWAETSPHSENPLNYWGKLFVYFHRKKRGCAVSRFLKGLYAIKKKLRDIWNSAIFLIFVTCFVF